MYAEVVLAQASSFSDKLYHYSIPQDLTSKVQVGSPVLIPFGRRKTEGFVVGLIEKSEVAGIKDILSITAEQPLFTAKQVELAKWLAEYYCSFFVAALKLVMVPGGKSPRTKTQNTKNNQNPRSNNQLKLTAEQQKALDSILGAIESGKSRTFLLHGITGSGKTEIYLQATAEVLQLGKSAIVLVPEIGLTPQLVQRFEARFPDSIAVLHSALTLKQRQTEWERIKNGQARIILGARSAIFAPVDRIGLIVIDEEYETTYKSEKSPRHHVREVAGFLSQQHQAVVVLGSATPSLETYFQAERGAIKKLVLPQRIDNRPLPAVEIVDLREDKGFILSKKLRQELTTTLENKQQAILFINRRGFFTFVICQKCGFTLECPQCSISLTYHSKDRKLRCHRCDYVTTAPQICPRCNESAISYFGTGTQRIEKEVADIFPSARILRYDRDAVSQRGSHELIFKTFAEGGADVLIGTQMVTKGLDVANVTLVGVISADTALHLPDFRAAERTFQLLTQVAGRAGRHHLPGKVIIQTLSPEHYAIQAAAKQDYELFYNQEIKYRQELNYPPFSKLINLTFAGKEEKKVSAVAEEVKVKLQEKLKAGVLGPAPSVIPRLRGRWSYNVLLKAEELATARNVVVKVLQEISLPKDVNIAIDIEPLGMV